MDKQDIYNRVKTHLLAQGKRSVGEDGLCRYRGEGGCKCAIGPLISDEVYDPTLEGESVFSAKIQKALIKSGILRLELPTPPPGSTEEDELICRASFDLDFLGDLQSIHDATLPNTWESELVKFAQLHKLQP